MELRIGHLDNRLRSKGCLSCIRMKVKCDQTKPDCRRCLRSRRECPGYRAQTRTFIVDTPDSGRYITSAPTKAPPTDWMINAVNHYAFKFVLGPIARAPGIHDSLPRLYMQSASVAYFQSAFQAVALALLARATQMSNTYSVRAEKLYGKAIRGLRVALNDETESVSATALMATELLSQYDLISGLSQDPLVSPHRQGMLHILEQRLHLGLDEYGTSKAVFIDVMLQNIGRDSAASMMPPPFEMFPGGRSNNKACQLLGLIHRVASMCRSFSAENCDETIVAGVLRQLHEELMDWECTLEHEWRYALSPATSNARFETGHEQVTMRFPGPHASILFASSWQAHLDVLQRFYEVAEPSEKKSIEAQMLLIVDKMCLAVGPMTGRTADDKKRASPSRGSILASVFAIRSLFIALQTPNLPEDQKTWMKKELEHVGHRQGIGMASILTQHLAMSTPDAINHDDQCYNLPNEHR